MMMDWDSHINIEYSDSGHCVQYLYKYCYKGPTQREQIEMDLDQMPNSDDEMSSLGDKTVAGSDRSCISSTSFGIQII